MKKIKFALFMLAIAAGACFHADAQVSNDQYEIAAFPDLDRIQSPIKPAGPEWMNTATFYEIYPQTFYDSNGDGIGDLKGIITKLDYVKSLGVDAIWLNPFYVSPFRDAGYDVSDYYHVAPRYGTDQDAKDLFRIAKEKGLHVIIDFVPGHTSIDHPWFKASCSPLPNKYSNWYIWTNGTWFNGMEKYKENFIQGYCDRDGNYMTNFFWHQPALNYGWGKPDPNQPWQLPVDNPDVTALKAEMKNVMKYWLGMGCSGFRIDMAGSLVKNDPDQSIRFFWQDVRKMLDTQYPDAFIVSEWSNPKDAVNAGFHADFMHWFEGYDDLFIRSNSFFRASGEGNISHFLHIYFQQYAFTKGKGYISLPVGNHDIPRINNNGRDQRDLEIIQTFAFTMPNVPFVYYGDEIGLRQLDTKNAKEGCYGGRAGTRTPMQWDDSKNLGFSTAPLEKVYLPFDTAQSAPTVMAQQNDPASLLNFIRQLVALHKSEPALSNYAAFVPVYAQKDKYPFVYMRLLGGEKILIVLNPSNKPAAADIKGELKGSRKLLMGSAPAWKVYDGRTIIQTEAKSFAIMKIK
jgi:maltose alpha-D-glucosyltransferase/alpha-amylase